MEFKLRGVHLRGSPTPLTMMASELEVAQCETTLGREAVAGAREAGGGPGVAGTSSLDGPREVEHRSRAQRPSHVLKRCVSIVIM